MTIQFANRFATRTTAAIAVDATVLPLESVAGFPDISNPDDYTFLTIVGAGGVPEIVRADEVSGNNVTVVRAQESTAAAAHSLGSRVEIRVSAGFLQALQDEAGAVDDFLAGETLGRNRMVVIDDNTKAVYADSTDPTHADRVFGMTLNAAAIDDSVNIRKNGIVENAGWSWTLANPRIFLSTSGNLTQTVPTTGFVCVVGQAVSATKLLLNIRPSVQLSA